MGWKIVLVLVLSTWLGLAVTALVLRAAWRPEPPGDAAAEPEIP
jgi:putative effector of murein hydrolase LrgA (UPF0299 family)